MAALSPRSFGEHPGFRSAHAKGIFVAFPTGDGQGKLVTRHQPVTLAAMEGFFKGGPFADLAVIGQPNVAARTLENPIVVPGGPQLPGVRDVRQHRSRLERLYD
jgi:cytochrome bd-type quinol oxidase subunit 1